MLTTKTLASGTDFDGQTNSGELLLLNAGVTNLVDDTQRHEIFSVAIQATGNLTGLIVRLAANRADALDPTGTVFLELLNAADVVGQQRVCCRCIVPIGWNLYAFTTEDAPQSKTLIVDSYRVTLGARELG